MLKQVELGLLMTILSCVTPVQAHTPVKFLEVLQGEPANLIEHGVELRGYFDEHKAATNLEGPHYFSLAVGCLGRKVEKQKAYLAWYKIKGAKQETPRKVAVIDLIRGAESEPLKIESAEYFLSPSQRVTSGPPEEIPVGLDQYKAYPIQNAASRELSVELVGSEGPEKRVVGKPLFLCVAAEEWHHDEFFAASHGQACFVVYELDAKDCSKQISLMDQFGLNQFNASKSRWLCVHAMISSSKVE